MRNLDERDGDVYKRQPETIFEKLFVTGEADVVAELHTANKSQAPDAEHLQRWEKEITRVAGNVPTGIAFRNSLGPP